MLCFVPSFIAHATKTSSGAPLGRAIGSSGYQLPFSHSEKVCSCANPRSAQGTIQTTAPRLKLDLSLDVGLAGITCVSGATDICYLAVLRKVLQQVAHPKMLTMEAIGRQL